MKADMVNFTIQSLRPQLLQQAAQYERAKFQQILDKQPGKKRSTLWVILEESDFEILIFMVIANFAFNETDSDLLKLKTIFLPYFIPAIIETYSR